MVIKKKVIKIIKETKEELKIVAPVIAFEVEKRKDFTPNEYNCPRCGNILKFIKFGEYKCENTKCLSGYSGFPSPKP